MLVPLAAPLRKIVYFSGGPVVRHDFETAIVHIQNQILTHNGQADYADIRLSLMEAPLLNLIYQP